MAPDTGPEGISLTFQLIVTDTGGLQSSDSCVVIVSFVNNAPVANAGGDQTATENSVVTLSASESSDPDGSESTCGN